MKVRRSGILAALVTAVLSLAAAAPASPTPRSPLGGSPLNVYVGERGQLQAFRTDRTAEPGIFYPGSEPVGRRRLLPRLPARPSREAPPNTSTGSTATPARSCSTNTRWCPPSAVHPGRRHCRRPAQADHEIRRQHGTLRHPDDHLRERHTGVPDALGRPQQHRQFDQPQGTRRRRLLLRGRRLRHRHLHRRAAPIHRRHQPRLRQLGRIRRSDRRRARALVGIPGPPIRLGLGRGLGQDRGERRRASGATFDDSVLAERPSTTPAASSGTRTRPARASRSAQPAPSSSWSAARVPSALQLNPTNAGVAAGRPDQHHRDGARLATAQPYAGKSLRYSIVGPNAATGGAILEPGRHRRDHRSRRQSGDRHGDRIRRLQRQRHPRARPSRRPRRRRRSSTRFRPTARSRPAAPFLPAANPANRWSSTSSAARQGRSPSTPP